MPLWTFAAEVGADRADRLLGIPDFEHVLQLLDTATVVSLQWKAFENERLRGCHRAEYKLHVHPNLYDAVFNAPVGLRGQYARSAAHGESANRRAVSRLTPTLLAFDALRSDVPQSDIEWSLCGAQAKIWIDENEVQSQLGGIEPQIIYAPWAANSDSGVGLLAPRGTCLEVKGAWLSAAGTIVTDPAKISRSEEIHHAGYS